MAHVFGEGDSFAKPKAGRGGRDRRPTDKLDLFKDEQQRDGKLDSGYGRKDKRRGGGRGHGMDSRSDLSDSQGAVSLVGGFRHQDYYGKQKFRDTISELYDDQEKDAVFRSSMKKGGAMNYFNQSLKLMG